MSSYPLRIIEACWAKRNRGILEWGACSCMLPCLLSCMDYHRCTKAPTGYGYTCVFCSKDKFLLLGLFAATGASHLNGKSGLSFLYNLFPEPALKSFILSAKRILYIKAGVPFPQNHSGSYLLAIHGYLTRSFT
ncbi:hypothetical protein KP509_02G063900 [Ceratopteris richardii]|uniref:Uncharacterized protein n=1 Tax=Ceratopteris richardii TaxID=49495 RepID=A0A8T2VEQ1_CERRI|nr:hypothetical protein KP509_02G063900 [Ceratopteris richardii]